jgi:hypothetical protein
MDTSFGLNYQVIDSNVEYQKVATNVKEFGGLVLEDGPQYLNDNFKNDLKIMFIFRRRDALIRLK